MGLFYQLLYLQLWQLTLRSVFLSFGDSKSGLLSLPKFYMGYRKIRTHSLVYTVTLLILDVVVLAGIFANIVFFRQELFGTGGRIEWEVISAVFFATVVPLSMVGGYNRFTPMHHARFFSEHAIASSISFIFGFALVYSFTTFGETLNAARGNVGFALLCFPVVSILYRSAISTRVHRSLAGQTLFVMGEGSLAKDFYHLLQTRKWHGEVHFFATHPRRMGQPLIESDPSSPILRSDLNSAVSENLDRLSAVVIAAQGEELSGRQKQQLMEIHFRETVVQSFYSFCSSHWRFVPTSQLSLWWVIDDGFRLNRNLTFERFKRFSDILSSGIGLILLAPLFAVVALLIRMESPGPAIFRQLRVGMNEHTFMVYKFRSMRMGSDKGDKYTRKGDNRVTRLGNFLRRSRIDELPQLWNVFKGDMSLIGPRAEWVELVRDYEMKIPYYHFRHLVRPGITGWAQVNYPYGENLQDTIEKLKYDLYYVRHYNFNLDFTIVLKTIYTMLGGKGQ